MDTLAIKQSKFNGEISPAAYGDTAHPKYASSLKTCKNWIPIPQGSMWKRPGTRYIATAGLVNAPPRLIPFVFSDGQSFVLEVGANYILFYQRGKYVGNDGNLHTPFDGFGGGAYDIGHAYTQATLPFLKHSQVGDVVTLCYGGQAPGFAALAPQDLRHSAGALQPWSLVATPLKIPAGAVTWAGSPTDAVPPYQFTGATTGPIWNKGERSFAGDVTTLTLDEWISIQDNVQGGNRQPPNPAALNSTGTSVQGSLDWMPAVDLSHPAIKSNWVQTAVVQEKATGVVFESGPSPVLTINSSLASDRQRPIFPRVPTVDGAYTLLFYRFYRAPAGGIFGWVNDVAPSGLVNYANDPANSVWLDDGRAPDYTRQPPQGTDPFLVNGADSFPAVIGYLDQRRLWADSPLLPSSVILSRLGDLFSYDGSIVKLLPGSDTDAMLITLASEVLEQIRSFVPMRRGLLMTAQGEWALAGQGGGPVSRSSLDVKRQSTWGSSWLDPIKIGTGVLFNTGKNNMVRDLYPLYGLYADIWDGQDLTAMVRHLFDMHSLSDWHFQSTPYPVVWAVRDDGVLLSLTYQHAPPSFGQQLVDGVVAWAQHTTGPSDAFESICVVPEPPEDAVYLVARRVSAVGAVTRYIERMNSPICPASPYKPGVSDVRYAAYLDSYVTYDGHNDQIGYTGVNAVLDSLAAPGSADPANYAIGSLVKVSIAGGPFVAGDAAAPYGSSFVLDPENLLGLNGAAGAVSGRVVGFTSTAQVAVELDVAMTQAQVTAWRAGRSRWAIGKGKFAALHLTGYAADSGTPGGSRGVIGLVDGDVQQVADWTAGVASFASPGVVIQLGLAYNADAELLDLYMPNLEIKNRFKNVVRIGFDLAGTRDMWGGKDLTSLAQLQERNVTDAYATMGLHTGYFEIFLTGGVSKTGAAALRHFQPLPAIVSSVLREVSLGGS